MTDKIREADDDNPAGYYELEAVKKTRSDSSWLQTANGYVVKVIYALLKDLPNNFEYRVIFMNRNIKEVVASQAKMLERRGEKGASVNEEKLIQIFESQLVAIKAWLSQQANYDVIEVDYSSVVGDTISNAATINDFLGGHLDPRAMVDAVDSKLYRNRASS